MSDYVSSLFNLEGKVALLTGAGGFLVGEISRALGKSGVRGACCDAKIEHAERTGQQIVAAGGQAIAIQIDVRQRDAHERALAETLRAFGRLDCLLNGAGINAPTPFLEIPLEEWNDILAVQLTGTMLGCQVFGGHLVSQRSGSIVNISSASSGPPLSRAFTYSVAKAGVKKVDGYLYFVDKRYGLLQQRCLWNHECRVMHILRIENILAIVQVLDEWKNNFIHMLEHCLGVHVLPLRPSAIIVL